MISESNQDEMVGAKLTAGHYIALLICTMVNGIDGFDILTISYIVGPLSKVWRLSPTDVGMLLSAGFVGMIVGTAFLSSLADIVGRKRFILLCLLFVGVGMAWSASTRSLYDLAAARVWTGVGLGPATGALIAIIYEYMPSSRRTFALGILGIGFPLGASVGGFAVASLLVSHGWQSVFWLCAVLTFAFVPVVLLFLPESIPFLIQRRPTNALARLNRARKGMRLAPLAVLPEPAVKGDDRGPLQVLSGRTGFAVVKWSVVYFLYMMSFYFILSWAAKLLSQIGFVNRENIAAASLITVGGIAGSLLAGPIARLLGLRVGAGVTLLAMAALIAAFPVAATHGNQIYGVAVVLGVAMWASLINLYALTAGEFPVSARASALGLAFGAGRIGAVFGPYAAGILLAKGIGIDGACLMLGAPAGVVIFFLGRRRCRSGDLVPTVD